MTEKNWSVGFSHLEYKGLRIISLNVDFSKNPAVTGSFLLLAEGDVVPLGPVPFSISVPDEAMKTEMSKFMSFLERSLVELLPAKGAGIKRAIEQIATLED